MSGVLRRVSALGRNFFACLPGGREAFAVLEKPGRFPSRRVWEDSPGVWLAGTKGTVQGLSPGGWGGSQREAFCSAKLLIFLAEQSLPVMPCRFSGWKPASQAQGRWVSKLSADRLSVAY